MKHKSRTAALALLMGGMSLAWVANDPTFAAAKPVDPKVDLLLLPSPPSARPEKKLLLDLTRAGDRLVAVGEFGLVAISTDQGKTWRQRRTPTSVMLTGVSFVSPTQGFAVGHDGVVLATADAGETWQRVFDGGQANAAVLKVAQERFAPYENGKGNEKDRLAAEDKLISAEEATKAGPSRPFMSVQFEDAQRGWVAGSFGQLFRTEDGGKTWAYFGGRLKNPEGLHLNQLQLGPNGEVFIAAEAGVVFSSKDRGQTWTRGETGYAGHLYGLVLPLGNAQTIVAYGFKGNLFRSENGGRSWNRVASPVTRTLVSAAKIGPEIRLLTDNGLVVTSSDAGKRFELTSKKQLGGRKFTAFQVLPQQIVSVGEGGVTVTPISDGKQPN